MRHWEQGWKVANEKRARWGAHTEGGILCDMKYKFVKDSDTRRWEQGGTVANAKQARWGAHTQWGSREGAHTGRRGITCIVCLFQWGECKAERAFIIGTHKQHVTLVTFTHLDFDYSVTHVTLVTFTHLDFDYSVMTHPKADLTCTVSQVMFKSTGPPGTKGPRTTPNNTEHCLIHR
jgi:hypothetical protein